MQNAGGSRRFERPVILGVFEKTDLLKLAKLMKAASTLGKSGAG
jgi:hypothetical protein